MRNSLSRRGLAAVCIFTAAAYATAPTWWTTQNVVTSGATANDYAAANIGQVKQIAYGAYNEMQAKLPGGAGPTVTSLITAWLQLPQAGVTRNDYAVANLGQLKAIAQPFYDRLAEVGYSGPPLSAGQRYPWSGSANAANDYAMANLGQVKFVFSFVLGISTSDTDGNGLPDAWERLYFNNTIGNDPNSDPDGDGLKNWQEALLGTNPTNGSDGTMPTVTGASVQVVLAMPDGTFRGVTTTWNLVPVVGP